MIYINTVGDSSNDLRSPLALTTLVDSGRPPDLGEEHRALCTHKYFALHLHMPRPTSCLPAVLTVAPVWQLCQWFQAQVRSGLKRRGVRLFRVSQLLHLKFLFPRDGLSTLCTARVLGVAIIILAAAIVEPSSQLENGVHAGTGQQHQTTRP